MNNYLDDKVKEINKKLDVKSIEKGFKKMEALQKK